MYASLWLHVVFLYIMKNEKNRVKRTPRLTHVKKKGCFLGHSDF